MFSPGIWMLQPSHEHHSTDPFSFVADYDEWFHALLRGHQFMARSHQASVGVMWLLPSGDKFPGASNHAGTTGHPLQGNGVGDSEKPQWDMVFLLIMPSIVTGCKTIFGLVTVWVHPCQACYTTLTDVTCKVMLLIDGSTNWVYTFIQLNKVLSHAPLSSMGHISTMTHGAPSTDAHSWLHQLQVCKLLQYKDLVICPEGLNSQMEAS